MITLQEIAAMEEALRQFPRPLRRDIKLSPGETVTDPEIFIETQISLLRERKDSPHTEIVYRRLNKWKEQCGENASK